ncbi:MAG: hypothetical protein J6Z41_00045 [Prevotella sp.]|nr:hypothetical protein [Prevotella sp.]
MEKKLYLAPSVKTLEIKDNVMQEIQPQSERKNVYHDELITDSDEELSLELKIKDVWSEE